jgi:hypothetical protein
MTGVEAVSNGVRAFREPGTRNARITLTIIIGILVLLLLGIAYLAQVYHIGATDPGSANYQSVLSQLLVAVFGRGIFYYVSIAGILLVLAFSANTAFADFPRLCQIVAGHKYLPSSFASRGRRLVFSQGIYVLTALSALLLIIFGGVTDRLIPLFAVGAFLAFTLSQAGMVVHWKRNRTKGWRTSMALNGLGAAATLVTVLVVLAAKFVAGAWITALLIPAMVITMFAIRRHYARIERELRTEAPLQLMHMRAPIVIVPIKGWDRATKKALSFAVDLSPDVLAVYVEINEGSCEPLRQSWEQLAVEPAKKAGFVPPQMEVMYSPFRQVLSKIVEVARREATLHPDRQIMVVIPELVENHWYHFFLHSQRAAVLKTMLYFLGNRHIVVANVPWYLEDHPEPAPANAAMPPEPSTAESPNA